MPPYSFAEKGNVNAQSQTAPVVGGGATATGIRESDVQAQRCSDSTVVARRLGMRIKGGMIATGREISAALTAASARMRRGVIARRDGKERTNWIGVPPHWIEMRISCSCARPKERHAYVSKSLAIPTVLVMQDQGMLDK